MITLAGQPLTLEVVRQVAENDARVQLDPAVAGPIHAARQVVEAITADGRSVYGINTGFGKLSDVPIPNDQLSQLQLNLVRSHACGVGEPLNRAETRAMMLLRANVLATGFSGARFEVLEHLIAMLNSGVHPLIPSRGSVGASGDLAPLAHLALGAIGEGKAEFRGRTMPATEALNLAGLKPLTLEAKEGLVLLNGTQAMGALGILAVSSALDLVLAATLVGAMTLEALKGTPAAFDERIHQARRHESQIQVANWLRRALDQSEIRESHRNDDPRVQDAYSLRCMPQVHGAALGALTHVRSVLELESGAATDNPLVFTDSEDVISGGNFHGAPLSYALDYAAIAVTDLVSISERRIDRLVNPDSSEGLPPFLARKAGLESGLMIPHVVAAGLLAECRVLAHPSSVDSVSTSGGKEDHVSMGMTGALKLRQIMSLAWTIIAIEAIAAAEGVEHRRPLRAGTGVERTYESVRSVVKPLVEDRVLSEDIENLSLHLSRGALNKIL